MQNHKTIQLTKKLSCTAFEMSVEQILSVLWLMGDYLYPEQLNDFASKHQTDLLHKAQSVIQLTPKTDLLTLQPGQFEAVLNHFIAVNAAFFTQNNAQQEKENQWGGRLFSDNKTGLDQYRTISETAAAVARNGHPNVLHYPYSYFLIVIDNLQDASHG